MAEKTFNKEFIDAIEDGNYYLALSYLDDEKITVRLINILNLLDDNSLPSEPILQQLITRLNSNDLSPDEIFAIKNNNVLNTYLKIKNPDPIKVGQWLDKVNYFMLDSRLEVWIKHYGTRGLTKKFLKNIIETKPELRDLIASYSPELTPMIERVKHREDMSRTHNVFRRLFDD